MALSDNPTLSLKLQMAARLAQLGDAESAVQSLKEIFKSSDINPDILNDCGAMLDELGEKQAALDCYQEAVKLRPDFAEAHNNLANSLKGLGQYDDAIRHYRLGLTADPSIPDIYHNLGIALRDQGDLADARTSLKEAVRIQPDYAEAWSSLGNVAALEGDNEEAKQYYEKSLALSPRDGLRLRTAMMIPAIPESETAARETRRTFREELARLSKSDLSIFDPLSEVGTTPFNLAYLGENDRSDLETLAALYRKASPALTYVADHCREYDGPFGDKIHIGFISSHLRNHTLGRLMAGLIRLLPRDLFNVSIFTPSPDDDEIATSIRDSADSYVVLPGTIDGAQETIAQDRLDILVHVGVGLDPFNYFLAFARLAPVQCLTWGHPVTSGIDTLDYYLSSAHAEVKSADVHYSEQLVRLSHYATYFTPPQLPDRKWKRHDFGLPETGAIYLCPQSLFKFDVGFDHLIDAILHDDPEGCFVMIEGQRPEHTRLVRERFSRSLTETKDRVLFLPRQPSSDFLGLISVADAVIDTPNFCGGVTSLEAMALATPVVTLPSQFRRGRLTYAQYLQMGMDDLIAQDEDEFVRLAVRLGTDNDFNVRMRNEIREAAATLFENDAVIEEHTVFFQDAIAKFGGRR